MGLNISRGNMYKDVTHTWNPLAGECPHRCSYCSTKRLMQYPVMQDKYSGQIRLEENFRSTALGKGNRIFVCAQNDLFAKEVPERIILAILEMCKKAPENEYIFQSKNPFRILTLLDQFPSKSIFGTTIETNRVLLLEKYSAKIDARSRALAISKLYSEITFITIEPIMDFDIGEFLEILNYAKSGKIYIGADSGNNKLPEPDQKKLQVFIKRLEENNKVIIKDNLRRILK